MRLNNIHNSGRKVYLFSRDDNYNLEIKEDNSLYPYYFEPSDEGEYISLDGKKLKKIIVNHPKEISTYRSSQSYCSDLKYVNRYIIDKVDTIDKSPYVYSFFDIEVVSDEFPKPEEAKYPVVCITIWDSFTRDYKTFFIEDYKTETKLLDAFIDYIQIIKPDIISGWNGVKFDYQYLNNRVKDFSKRISPIGESRGGEDNMFFPAGISILDYLSLFRKVLMREQSYALDAVSQKYLKEESWKQETFSILDNSIKEKNINDIKRMVKLEEKFNLMPYYDEIRRMTFVKWEDLYHNSRLVESMLFKEAKEKNLILPNKSDSEEQTFEGATRGTKSTGLFRGLGKYDLGCYSDDTSLLTQEGWKKYNELKLGELVASFEPKNNHISFQPLLYLHVYPYKGKYLRKFKSNGLEQLLTDNHKVLYKSTDKAYKEKCTEKWKICFANNIPTSHSILPLSFPRYDGKDYKYMSDDLIKLHAWIITEGDNNYNIYQSIDVHPKYCEEIDCIFKNLNWKHRKSFRKSEDRKNEVCWSLPENLKKIHIKLEEDYKAIPLWMLQKFSIRQLKILYYEMMKGDGAKTGKQYFAKSDLAKERFQFLCVLLGFSAYYKEGTKTVYVDDSKYTNFKQSKVKYEGNVVWCPTVSSGFVVVKRPNSRPFISGNSAYPSMIFNFCLDTQNIGSEGIEINGIKFKQNENVLLPSVVRKVLKLKDDLKSAVKKDKTLKNQYAGIKSVANSFFGVCSNRFFRLSDNRIAETIAYLVRDLIHYTIKRLESEGIQVQYWDTDSVVINTSENIVDKLNEYIQDWGKIYGKDSLNLKYDFEGVFESLFILGTCHYYALLNKGNEIEVETKGIEMKRSSSCKYEAWFQENLLTKIIGGAKKDEILDWINEEKDRIKTLTLRELGFPCKLKSDYKNVPIFQRAYLNSKERFGMDIREGDLFYYTFVKNQGIDKDGKNINVLAFKKEGDINKKIIDYDEIIRRTIFSKAEKIFEAMGWTTFELLNSNQKVLF